VVVEVVTDCPTVNGDCPSGRRRTCSPLCRPVPPSIRQLGEKNQRRAALFISAVSTGAKRAFSRYCIGLPVHRSTRPCPGWAACGGTEPFLIRRLHFQVTRALVTDLTSDRSVCAFPAGRGKESKKKVEAKVAASLVGSAHRHGPERRQESPRGKEEQEEKNETHS
jgi:hypothetical protein